MRSRWLSMTCLALLATSAWAQIVAVPPAANRGTVTAKDGRGTLITPAHASVYSIDLPAPTPEEQAKLKSPVPGNGAMKAKRHVRPIGFSRKIPGGDRPLPLAGLPWQSLADGGRAARIVVHSPGAAGIRLGLSVLAKKPGVTLRFAGSGSQVYGPYPAETIAREKVYWSPVLNGELATVELYLPSSVAPDTIEFRLPKISHLASCGRLASPPLPQPIEDIGCSSFCEIDIACVTTPAASSQARSVAKLVFTEDGVTSTCTGTLINDSAASNTPYIYTASHCMESQEAASSLVTYWFFDAVGCGNSTVPPYATVTGGAQLLARSVDSDWALIRLNNPPPAEAIFSAWRAEVVGDGTNISVLHHPQGDLKKISQGTMPGYSTFDDGTSFASVQYMMGSTEPGSSGSGLLTLSSGGFYELRGGLFAGDDSCLAPSGHDWFSRLDVALPLLAPYLTPSTPNPTKTTPVVEYYYAGYDDYFITANALEIQALDGGAHPGWVRTGLTFLAYSDLAVAPAGTQPVCRFYLLPQFGDSHFYSADPAECAATATKFAGSWVQEAAALFYIQVPDRSTGVCPVNTRPVYRFLNRNNQIHHRYTVDVDVRNCMYYGIASEDKLLAVDCSLYLGSWLQEGYGTSPNASVMCSPSN